MRTEGCDRVNPPAWRVQSSDKEKKQALLPTSPFSSIFAPLLSPLSSLFLGSGLLAVQEDPHPVPSGPGAESRCGGKRGAKAERRRRGADRRNSLTPSSWPLNLKPHRVRAVEVVDHAASVAHSQFQLFLDFDGPLKEEAAKLVLHLQGVMRRALRKGGKNTT